MFTKAYNTFKQKTAKTYQNLKKKTTFPFMTSEDRFDSISKDIEIFINRNLGHMGKKLLIENDGGILTEDLMHYIPRQYLNQWDNDLIFNLNIQNHPDRKKARRYRQSLQKIMKEEENQVKKGIKQNKQKLNPNLSDEFYFHKYYKTEMTQNEKLQAAAEVIKTKGLHKKLLKQRYSQIKKLIEEYIISDEPFKLLQMYLEKKQFPELKIYNKSGNFGNENEEKFLEKVTVIYGNKLNAYFENTVLILNRVLNDKIGQTQQARYNPKNYQISTE